MPKPKILKRLISQLERKGMPTGFAHATAIKTLQKSGNLKPGTNKATAKGVKRGKMGAAGRAKDRESKRAGRKSKEYVYNSKTNRATRASQ